MWSLLALSTESEKRGEENQPVLACPAGLSMPNFIIPCTNVGGSVVNAVDSQKYKTFYSYLHNNAMT
jgi:hypothetical protein